MAVHLPGALLGICLALSVYSPAARAQASEPVQPIIEPRLDLSSPGGARSAPFGFDLDLNLYIGPDTRDESPSDNVPRPSGQEVLREGLDRVDWLQRAGALGLAERMLLDRRPPLVETEQWIEWERRLWSVYQERRHWDVLAARVEDLPQSLPRTFLLEAQGLGVEALMQQRLYPEARARLRALLLTEDVPPSMLADWRRKVFTTYLWNDDLVDADAAMLQYQYDYYPDDHNWNLLRARVMIRSGETAAAVSQIASVTTSEGTLVGLYGRLLSGSMTPNEVIQRAMAIDDKAFSDSLRRERHALIAEAARRSGGLPDRANALEQALSIAPQSIHQALVEVDSSDLVDTYMRLAERIANSGNLLVGDYEGWLKHAERELRDSPVGARAVFAYVGRSVALPELANDAFSRLAASLRQSGLKPVIFELFGEQGALGGFDSLRGPVGYLLSEEALEDGDIKLAAALSASIVQPPAGVSYFDWRLRQARMSVYAGRIEEGVAILQSLTEALNSLRDDEADRMLQVIFDLQALDRHTEALPLLERILELTSNADRQREVLFWLAESLEGDGAPEQAALYFLRSATMAGSNRMWVQSAQYRAAGALQNAGLLEDARSLYRQLLATTRDAGQREQLTRRLQDLWLLENKANDSAPGT